jgi:hypothetical protein
MLPLSFIAIFSAVWMKVIQERSTVFDRRNVHLLITVTYFIIGSTIQEFEASSMYVILQLMGPAYSYWIVGRSFDEILTFRREPAVSCGAIYVIAYEPILVFFRNAKRTWEGREEPQGVQALLEMLVWYR